MKIKFSRILGISAIMIASCAAYYSVFGLSQLFAGASLAVIIMASALEISKIVAVSFLQRYWSRVSRTLSIYLSVGVIVLMIITSAGIYGFLSNAYQKTAVRSEIFEGQMGVLGSKKGIFEKAVIDNGKIVETKNKRIAQLTDLRSNQESRLDQSQNSRDRSRARGDIDIASKEIQKLSADIDTLNARNGVLNDSISHYSGKEFETKTGSAVAGELGPLKYLAELTGKPMSTVVNWFILLLIFVFDPMAVALVIATNKVLELERTPVKVVDPKEPEDIEPEVEEFIDDDDIEEPEPEDDFSLDNEVEIEAEVPVVAEVNEYPIEEVIPTQETIEEPIIEGPAMQEEIVEEPQTVETEYYVGDINQNNVVVELPTLDREPIIANGKITREDIKEIKESTRNFSVNVPHPPKRNNEIGRI